MRLQAFQTAERAAKFGLSPSDQQKVDDYAEALKAGKGVLQ